MKKTILMGLMVLLAACQQKQDNKDVLQDNSRVLLTINKQPITEKMVQVYLLNKGINDPDESQINATVEQLTEQQLWVNYAHQQNIELSQDQQMALVQLNQQMVAQQAVKQYLADNPVTDDEITAEYNRVIAEVKDLQFKVHHLLYKDEVDALTALDELTAGANFLDLEQSYVQQYGHLKNVGDIGWVNLKQVPESFAEPLQNLSVGHHHQQPIISQFGVHIIYLEDKKTVEPPSFEQAKEGIKRNLQSKKINRFKQLLRAKADINSSP
ncbi:MAG: hypothetical protein DWP95_01965 [Proteobacteria bacterium]|nr:MAG: hypothetical protein DWP95_01965 [Pseudomonadota bacterium]